MATRTISWSRLTTDLPATLNECAASGETILVETPDHRWFAIRALDRDESGEPDPGADAAEDDLTDKLIATNPEFRALLAKSRAGRRSAFVG